MELRKVYDSIAVSWSKLKNKPLTFVKDFIKKSKGLLLVTGCGSGRHSVYASSQGLKVIGIDFSIEMIRIAKKNDPENNYLVADVRALPFKDKSIDNALSIAVLHHLKPLQAIKAVKELKRVVKKNILISTWLLEKKGEQLIKWGEHKRYYYIYSEKEIEKLIRKEFKELKKIKNKKNIVLMVKNE